MFKSRHTFLICLLLFLVGTIPNFALRSRLGPVFDETTTILYIKKSVEFIKADSTLDYFKTYWKNIWYEPADGRAHRPLQFLYRPLHVILVAGLILSCIIFQDGYLFVILLHSFFLSLTGILFYLLGLRFTADHRVAAGGAFLTIFSVAAISGVWNGLTCLHPLVPILIIPAIWCYLRFKETNTWGWVVPIWLITFIGPLLREYISVALLVILLSECLHPRRNYIFLLSLIPFIFHSVFPAFLINVLFFHNITFSSPYIHKGLFSAGEFPSFHFEAINHFVFSLPPLLTFLAVIGLISSWQQRKDVPTILRITLGCIAFLGYLSLFVPEKSSLSFWAHICSLFFMVMMSLSVWNVHRVWAVWSLVGWVPYVLFFGGVEVHFLYALGPFAMILLWHVRTLMINLREKELRRFRSRRLKQLVIIFLVIAFTDQCLNLIAIGKNFQEHQKSAVTLAQWIATKTSAGQPFSLISSTLLAKDVSYHLVEEGQPPQWVKYTFWGAVNTDERCIDQQCFSDLVEKSRGNSRLYFLDSNIYPTLLSRFRKDLSYKISDTREYRSVVTYPHIDPLKSFIPIEYASFPGPQDFWSHYSQEVCFFSRRVWTSYILSWL